MVGVVEEEMQEALFLLRLLIVGLTHQSLVRGFMIWLEDLLLEEWGRGEVVMCVCLRCIFVGIKNLEEELAWVVWMVAGLVVVAQWVISQQRRKGQTNTNTHIYTQTALTAQLPYPFLPFDLRI